MIPRALFLSVFLSKASFLPKYVEHLNKTITHDVKIDVFFNGELSGSTYVSDRYYGDEYEMTEHIIRFSGRRVHRRLEKPWILVPSGQGPDGRSRFEKQNIESPGDIKQRWASVSKALLMEANRLSRGENGELSVLGDYLSALAALELPRELEAMHTMGGPKTGIIDVVITAGKGQIDDASIVHLTEPTPMRLEVPKKGNASIELDHAKDGSLSNEISIHQERMASQDVNITTAVSEAQAVAEAQRLSPNLTLDKTLTTPPKKRRSLGSRADSEILAQGFTSQPRALRRQSGLANDPVSGEKSY